MGHCKGLVDRPVYDFARVLTCHSKKNRDITTNGFEVSLKGTSPILIPPRAVSPLYSLVPRISLKFSPQIRSRLFSKFTVFFWFDQNYFGTSVHVISSSITTISFNLVVRLPWSQFHHFWYTPPTKNPSTPRCSPMALILHAPRACTLHALLCALRALLCHPINTCNAIGALLFNANWTFCTVTSSFGKLRQRAHCGCSALKWTTRTRQRDSNDARNRRFLSARVPAAAYSPQSPTRHFRNGRGVQNIGVCTVCPGGHGARKGGIPM